MTCQLWYPCKIIAVRQAVICQLHREIGKHVNHKHDYSNFTSVTSWILLHFFGHFCPFLDIFGKRDSHDLAINMAQIWLTDAADAVWQPGPSSCGAWKVQSIPRSPLNPSLTTFSMLFFLEKWVHKSKYCHLAKFDCNVVKVQIFNG